MALSEFSTADKIDETKHISGQVYEIADASKPNKRKYRLKLHPDNSEEAHLEFIWFWGNGDCPYKEGEKAEFTYHVNETGTGTFYNIKDLLNLPVPAQTVENSAKAAFLLPGDMQIWSETQKEANRAILMAKAVELCMKLNILGDKNIYETFDKLMKHSGQTPIQIKDQEVKK